MIIIELCHSPARVRAPLSPVPSPQLEYIEDSAKKRFIDRIVICNTPAEDWLYIANRACARNVIPYRLFWDGGAIG